MPSARILPINGRVHKFAFALAVRLGPISLLLAWGSR